MKGYCTCGAEMDEVQFTQFGKCEKCYMEDMERKKRNKFNCANRHDAANSCYHGRCSHCQSYEAIK